MLHIASNKLKVIDWILIKSYDAAVLYHFHSFIVEVAIMSAFSAIFLRLVLFVLGGIYGLLLLKA